MEKILVIDDEEPIRMLIKAILEKAGYEVDLAKNGIIALEKINNNHYCVIILDLLMPEKEGLETIREMLKMKPEIKIIAISGGGSNGDLDFLSIAKLFGAKSTLNKPFNKAKLLDTLQEVIKG
ncbi:MAG: response regulator [Candidatus Cloacimonadota bacterium]|nr:MAG: response regulator [Candidatus Cloacimonadota bacterium]